MFGRFWPVTQGLRRWMALTLGLVALLPLVEAAEVWLFKVLVDDVLVAADLGPLPWVLVSFVALNVVSAAIGFGNSQVSAWIRETFRLRLRGSLFGHILRLSPIQLGRRRTGDLLTGLSSDVSDVGYLLVSAPATAVESTVRIVAFAGMLFYLDWALAIVALVVAPVFWAAARRYTGRIRMVSAEKRRLTGDMNSLAEEVLSAVPQVQAAGAESHEEDRYHARGRAIRSAAMEASRLTATLRPITDLLELIGALLVIGAGAWSVVAGRQTIGELFAFLTYLTQLYSPTRSLTDLAASANSAAAGAERVQELLDEPPDVVDEPTTIQPSPVHGALSFRGVSLYYPGRDQPAVDALDLDIEAGQITAVVGPSGSGKSTLAALAMRLMDPETGSVLLDGHDVREYPLAFLRSSVGLLLQDTYLFHGTIADNVAYGSAPGADAPVAAALAGALEGADAGFVSSLGRGVGHHIGGNGRALSGGQRRRVALARVLMSAPPVLILDEFSTGQDPASVLRVLDRLRGRANTIVLITHDGSVAAVADRVVRIEGGRVVADTRQTTEAS